MKIILLLLLVPHISYSITCYKGLRIFRGQTFDTETEECQDEAAYCYNMTAEAALVLNIMKAGCSTYRCMLAANTCRSMTFQGVPVNFCCCNEHNLCNYDNERTF